MSHGVMAKEANLTYRGESGGLNESNSDIFGTMVEFYANSAVDVPDYLIGERLFKSSATKALRNMADPFSDGKSPACYTTKTKSLDVHYSSGANNHMFYLLAEGGVSKCNGKSVTGIGRAKAARVWYEAISNYMTASTGYAGARAAAISAAQALENADASYAGAVNAVKAAYSAINVN
jgi:Zn-dependent metalloprotease